VADPASSTTLSSRSGGGSVWGRRICAGMRRRHWGCAEQASSPVGSKTGSPVGFGLFCFFNSLTVVDICKAPASVKAMINYDLLTEVVAKTVSVKHFCPSRLKFL
jgi:hypothetical protein